MSLVDPETAAYRPLAELRAAFAEVGALEAERVITYCGGGIAASSDAFILNMLAWTGFRSTMARCANGVQTPTCPWRQDSGVALARCEKIERWTHFNQPPASRT